MSKRKERRRRIKPGYPKEFKFQTQEELDEYLSGDRITCLLCGREFKMIGCHLTRIHGISLDEYREIYGIPWGCGLCAKETSEKFRQNALNSMERGELVIGTKEAILKAQAAPSRGMQKVSKDSLRANILKAQKRAAELALNYNHPLRRARKKSGIPIETIAKKVGVGKAMLMVWEDKRKNRKPSVEQAEKLVSLLGVHGLTMEDFGRLKSNIELYPNLNNPLRRARKKSGIPIEAIAKAVGVCKDTIFAYENPKSTSRPSFEKAKKLVSLLGEYGLTMEDLGNPIKKVRVSRKRKQRLKLRRVLPGYPKEFKFEKVEDLREYFGHEKSITCLRCGKEYRTLGNHLRAIHQMTPDEYREMYGIPWRCGLCCRENAELHSEHAKYMVAIGIFTTPPPEMLRQARATERRPYVKIRDEIGRENITGCHKKKIVDK